MERVDCDADGYVDSTIVSQKLHELDEAKNREGRKGPMAGTGWGVDEGR